MNRISALRNVEEALRAFEAGEQSLDDTQRAVRSVLQTYATEFETDQRRPFRAVGGAADGTVVVAPDQETAVERVRSLMDSASSNFHVEPL